MSLKNTKVKVGKHKSKYTSPKDMEKSLKIPTRKNLKDYTHDDKDGGMNPYSTKEIQDLVPRKTDKLVINDVENMVPEIKHRVYQDLENGKLNFKEAKKIFKKLQIEDTEGYLEKREDIDHGVTTKPLDEQQIRSYIRNKIISLISEQPQSETPETAETPETPEPETPETPEQPQPETPETPEPETPETPEPETPETPETPEKSNEKDEDSVFNDFIDVLNKQVGVVGKLKIIFKLLRLATKDADPQDKKNLYRLTAKVANKKMHDPDKQNKS